MLSSNKLISYWMNKTFNVQQPLCLCAVEVLEDIAIFNVHHINMDLCRLHLVIFSLTTLSKLYYILLWDVSMYSRRYPQYLQFISISSPACSSACFIYECFSAGRFHILVMSFNNDLSKIM
jgi:hypothetical protein